MVFVNVHNGMVNINEVKHLKYTENDNGKSSTIQLFYYNTELVSLMYRGDDMEIGKEDWERLQNALSQVRI